MRVDIRTAPVTGAYKLTPEDQQWAETVRPAFHVICNEAIGVANAKYGADLNSAEMQAACKCSTQRVFSEVAISEMRGIYDRKDRAALTALIAPRLKFCTELMAKPR